MQQEFRIHYPAVSISCRIPSPCTIVTPSFFAFQILNRTPHRQTGNQFLRYRFGYQSTADTKRPFYLITGVPLNATGDRHPLTGKRMIVIFFSGAMTVICLRRSSSISRFTGSMPHAIIDPASTSPTPVSLRWFQPARKTECEYHRIGRRVTPPFLLRLRLWISRIVTGQAVLDGVSLWRQ